jgi:predicted esterase
MPPTPESPEKRAVETVVAHAARRAGVAALIPRGPTRDELAAPARDAKGLGAYRSWPTGDDAYRRHARRLVEHIASQRLALEALAGAPFERVFLGGSSAGAYFVAHLALRGDFPADGYAVLSGGSGRPAPRLAELPRRPLYVGYGDGDVVGPRAEEVAREARAAGWDVRGVRALRGHAALTRAILAPMGTIRDLSERLLSGATLVRDENPMAPRMAVEEVAPRVAFVSSFANVTAIDTDEGLVLVDTGSFFLAVPTKALVRSFTQRPLHTALFTHGHVDHVFGVDLYEAEGGPARVLAHEAVPRRFERYRLPTTTRGRGSRARSCCARATSSSGPRPTPATPRRCSATRASGPRRSAP